MNTPYITSISLTQGYPTLDKSDPSCVQYKVVKQPTHKLKYFTLYEIYNSFKWNKIWQKTT